MANKSYNRLVENRKRIDEKTLVVGVDIGKNFNALACMDKAGRILCKYPKVYTSRPGFEFYRKNIEKLQKKEGLTKVIVGMEPTGHYWRKLAYYSMDQGYEVRFIRTTALKHQRELDESSSHKCDVRDAVTISNIVREGKYLDSKIQQGVYRQLRKLGKVRERLLNYQTGTKQALRSALDDYFPELPGIFHSLSAKGLWKILEECPFPEDVLKMNREELGLIISQVTRRQKTAYEKADKLIKASERTIGLRDVGESDRKCVAIYVAELKRVNACLTDIEKSMKKLLKQIPEGKILVSIRGVGDLTASVLLGELGSPKNFTNYKKMVKYSGYDPVGKDSGNTVSRKWISRKGRYLLRKYLYFIAMRLVCHNDYFKRYYHEKQEIADKSGKKLKKKQALCAVVIKFIKVLFALFRDVRAYEKEPPQRVHMVA